MRIVYLGKKPEFRHSFLIPGRVFKPHIGQEVSDEEAKRLLVYPTFARAENEDAKNEGKDELLSDEPLSREQILALNKQGLADYAKTRGITLDRRKSLADMQKAFFEQAP